jgi:hypothetical protein
MTARATQWWTAWLATAVVVPRRLYPLFTLASGLGFTIDDNSRGSGIKEHRILLYAGRPPDTFNYKSVDFRVETIFRFPPRQQASVAFEGFNIFNSTNFKCYDGFIPAPPSTNPNFGQPSCTVGGCSSAFATRSELRE